MPAAGGRSLGQRDRLVLKEEIEIGRHGAEIGGPWSDGHRDDGERLGKAGDLEAVADGRRGREVEESLKDEHVAPATLELANDPRVDQFRNPRRIRIAGTAGSRHG